MQHKQFRRYAAPGAILLSLALQLVRCSHDNPPPAAPLATPDDVGPLVRRACFDCHSNETVWPWYSQVAPVSWLVHRDVVEGRRHLNFSHWPTEERKRAKLYREIAKAVGEGEMPMMIYPPLHPEARLSDAEKERIISWAKLAGSGPASSDAEGAVRQED